MFIYSRYLTKQLFWTTVFLTFAFTGAVWLTQSLRYIDFVMARGLPIFTFLKLISYLLPNLMATILPISLLIATLLVLHKFYTDNELIVLRAFGLSNLQLIKPSLFLACCVTLMLYFMNLYVHPITTRYYKEFKAEIRNSLTSFMIQPGEFNSFKKMTFFVKSRTRAGELQGVFIYDSRDAKKPIAITAEKGIILDKDNGLHLILFKGTRQSNDVKTKKPSILTFGEYSLEITNPPEIDERDRKPGEYFLDELLNPQANIEPRLRHKYKVEAHQRLLLPFTAFPFVLFACIAYLCGEYDRRGRTKRVIGVIFSCILLEVLILTLLNQSEKTSALIYSAYGVVLLTIISALVVLLQEQRLKWKQ